MTKQTKVRFIRPYFPRAALTANNLEFWVGREAEIDRVVRGLLAATNSHYLITGYPGIGKTSFVSRVIAEWRRMSALQGIERVLIFNLQFAQTQSPEEVVRKLIGKVYFGSLDGQFSPDRRLAERLQLNFIQAYAKSLKETQAETTTKDKGGEASLPKITQLLGSELKVSLKSAKERSKSIEIQREYNLNAVISDFEAVVHLLTKPEERKTWWSFFPFAGKRVSSVPPRVLFVFDQIDDLNSLQELSNLFSIPNASFIVLGGIRLKEQMASAQEKGLQVLDSFQEEYLSCQWDQSDKILSLLISPEDMGLRRFAQYRDHLNFFAQGLPRRLFSSIDQHTSLEGNEFYLKLSKGDLLRVRLGAKLHRIIWKKRSSILGEFIDNVQYYQRDKALRGIYHLADNIFRVAKFTFTEANTLATQMSDIMIHNERERVLGNLLRAFVDEGLIINKGNVYYLAEEVLKWVKQIPNWLKDGFVDAREFLADLKKYNAAAAEEETGVVQLRPDITIIGSGDPPPKMIPGEEPSPMDVPDVISRELSGRYQIIRKIGSGGMGNVYLARDKMLDRELALKIIHPYISKSPEFIQRILREGRIVANLSHPNVVQIYDMRELPSGQMVLVTEYVSGKSLAERIDEAPMPLEEALRIIIDIAAALEAAHHSGIIHRDIKPSNVVITEEGRIKLLDFGIAKAVADTTNADSPITLTGAVIGTPAFMAPEQMRGELVDPRTDLYSLGAVMYQMLTGMPHVKGNTALNIMFKVMHEDPVLPSTFNPSISPELDEVIMSCLARDPAARISSATELINRLRSILQAQKRNK
ncbi:MAG TPA: protein kinase [Pyrinomonadaceae bacterium]